MEIATFFNSKLGDRKYNAKHWADYFRPLFISGVFNGDLQVIANGKMSVTLKTGYAWLDGYGYHNTEPLVIDLEAASGNLNRYDAIKIRLDHTKRTIYAYADKGGNATAPAKPTNTRNDTVFEITVAEVYIAAGTTVITQSMITDTRMDESKCGWVAGTVKEIDFTQIYAQFQSYFEETAEQQEAEWNVWFEKIKTQLSGDVAGNLQNQINDEVEERQQAVEELNNKIGVLDNLKTSVKTNIVNAINTIYDIVKKISDNYVSGIRGASESSYRKGNVIITKANIGLGNVDNTKDADKSVKYATGAQNATFATNSYETKFASVNRLKETSIKNVPLELGDYVSVVSEDYDEDYTDVDGELEKINLLRTNVPGSFLVVRIGIQTGAWTIKNVIIPFPPSESGGVSVVGFNHYEGNFYKGILRWKPSDGKLEGELTGVSEGWANSIKIIDVWAFNCSH